MSKDSMDLKALFIGDKGENADLYKDMLNKLVDEHVGWRQNYMPQDMPVISEEDKQTEGYASSVNKMKSVLDEVSSKLRSESVPWHTAGRYLGHMNTETLMPAILAYQFAMLWNGNNVAYESSPATSQMEEEVGADFAQLLGLKDGWGHIVADGSLANLEGLWYARNMKSLPLAISEVVPEMVSGMSEWELLNMRMEDILDILDNVTDEQIDEIKSRSARSGKNLSKLGKWLVPQTKHYSWLKAADIIGIGLDQVVPIPVDSSYRIDVKELESLVRSLAADKTPILGVVGVVGSTEEGAVDPIHEIVKLREKLVKEKIYFYIHVDAAYGGYARSIFLDENNEVIPYEKLKETYKEYNIFNSDVTISRDVYDSFVAIGDCESVTIDPHKMGYIPYSAGGIGIKDIRMRNIISYFATYVFEKNSVAPSMLGAYILEGSKAGATAAAVWAAHHVLPLNVSGYGKLIGASIESATRFYNFLSDLEFNVNGRKVKVTPLINPDFNMVDYTFNEVGNTDLTVMNKLNHDFYDQASFVTGSLYSNEFMTSHTDFAIPDYGNSPFKYVSGLGFSKEEWEKVGKVTILRSSVMTPYLNNDKVADEYFNKIKSAMKSKLENILG
ncbi:tyrosine decarboxylase [Dellaglioa algida]|uniref:tyrosine decarboxylase n=1 Tax=Dellaglioa algida TaxID=105612 RepID=UPI0024C4B28E|nr:tyrosine decarboxylase [Dellaglioa algida]MDK1726711.1 tyrosine decarboxylase [Dellaglioa algida]MDK1740534.1 tyrosine decarboxylase [Dellaglioa algida]